MQTANKWQNEKTEELFKAILSLKNTKECERFFRDLMTEQEIETFADRFKAAQLLTAGKSYRTISKELKMSTLTVTRINNWLERGTDGYKLAIERLQNANRVTKAHHHKTTNSAVL